MVARRPYDLAKFPCQLPKALIKLFCALTDITGENKPVVRTSSDTAQCLPVSGMGQMKIGKCPRTHRVTTLTAQKFTP